MVASFRPSTQCGEPWWQWDKPLPLHLCIVQFFLSSLTSFNKWTAQYISFPEEGCQAGKLTSCGRLLTRDARDYTHRSCLFDHRWSSFHENYRNDVILVASIEELKLRSSVWWPVSANSNGRKGICKFSLSNVYCREPISRNRHKLTRAHNFPLHSNNDLVGLVF